MNKSRGSFTFFLAFFLATICYPACAQNQIVLTRDNSTIVLEPYAPNIVRVTLSLNKAKAAAAPGFGFIGSPATQGWELQHADAADVYRSSRIVVTVNANHPGSPSRTQRDIARFFNGSAPAAHITITTPDGKKLLEMTGWSMSVPNHKDGNAGILNDKRPTDPPFYQVGATFVSPDDEHYYGLGQNQEGFLDHRGHTRRMLAQLHRHRRAQRLRSVSGHQPRLRHVWDNPSKTTIEPGFNEQTTVDFRSGRPRVVLRDRRQHHRRDLLPATACSPAPRPCCPRPLTALSSASSATSRRMKCWPSPRAIATAICPLDVLVVDWFYYTKMGQIDLDPEHWPDPAAMNRQLHDMGFQTMISVWPRFVPRTRYYDLLLQEGWFDAPRRRHAHRTACPTTAPAPTSTPPIPMRPAGIGTPSATTSSAKASTRSGRMKPSPTCRPTAATSTSAPARATSTFIRCSTRRRSTTASAAT